MAEWYKDRKGYPRFSDSGKLVHRWKAEKSLGRELRPGEVVHHKNRCKTDYSDGNLHTFRSQSQHARAHRRDGW